jgi:hypothetical protein
MRVFFTISFSIISLICLGQVQATKYANEFLAIGVGGRAQGMGNTQIALAGDVTAGYWNPAGLLQQDDSFEGILQHGEYYSGIAKFDYLAFSMKLDTLSNLGFSLIRFGIDDIPDTRFLYDANGAINYDNVRFFTAADYAFISSYARKVKWLGGLQLGANFKIIYRQAGDFANAWGFGLDLGAKLMVNNWHFGVVFRDATGTFTAWSHNTGLISDVFAQTGNEIPQGSVEVTVPRLIFGMAHEFAIKDFGILPTMDVAVTFDGMRNTVINSAVASIDPRFGLELDYKKLAFVRLGLHNWQEITELDGTKKYVAEPTFGIGFKVKMISIDYALTSVGPQTEDLYSHVFSVKGSFNRKE